MSMLFIDNSQVRRFTDKLREMHRSNLPIAVRQTLNDMAFDVKKVTLLQSVDREFILRNTTFFRKHSGVKKADGWDIENMKAEVGIMPGSGKGSEAAKQLSKQETGGTIKDREAIYMDQARTGKSKTKRVRVSNYLKKKSIRGRASANRSRKSNFVAQAIVAQRENKYLLWQTKKGLVLFDVQKIEFSGSGRTRGVNIGMLPVASYKENRSVNVDSTKFFSKAAERSLKKREYFFIRNAKKRFEKALR